MPLCTTRAAPRVESFRGVVGALESAGMRGVAPGMRGSVVGWTVRARGLTMNGNVVPSTTAVPLPVAVGEIVAGKYRLMEVLGVGGMGIVMAATHLELGHCVALKFMQRAKAKQPRQVSRFLREARAACRLRGEHVARVSDVGRLGDGTPF